MHVGLLCVQHNPRDSPSMPFTVLMLSGEGSLPQAQKPCSYSERDLNEFEVGPSFKAFSTKEGRCFRFGAKTHEVPKLCEEGSPKMPLQCARVIGYAITSTSIILTYSVSDRRNQSRIFRFFREHVFFVIFYHCAIFIMCSPRWLFRL